MHARPLHPSSRSRTAWLAAPILLAGCATIFTGTTDVLTFDANVPGVLLTIDGQVLGELPRTVTISRNFVGGRQFVANAVHQLGLGAFHAIQRDVARGGGATAAHDFLARVDGMIAADPALRRWRL